MQIILVMALFNSLYVELTLQKSEAYALRNDLAMHFKKFHICLPLLPWSNLHVLLSTCVYGAHREIHM